MSDSNGMQPEQQRETQHQPAMGGARPVRQRSEDLEDLLESSPARRADASLPSASSKQAGKKIPIKALVAAGAIVLAGLVLWSNYPPFDKENTYPNWQKIQQLEQRHVEQAPGQAQIQADLINVAPSGAVAFVTGIGYAAVDTDAKTGASVQQALASGNRDQAKQAIKQTFPQVTGTNRQGQPIAQIDPQMTPETENALARGQGEFVQVRFFDSCAQDGDIVELQINGQPYAIVPLTHTGATLSVPVIPNASTSIAVRGIFDGGGGITVACQTSLGQYLSRTMQEGEVQGIGVVTHR